MLLTVTISNAQNKKVVDPVSGVTFLVGSKPKVMTYDFVSNDTGIIATVKVGSDTLEVFYGKQIHYIKIGDIVYEIKSPHLEQTNNLILRNSGYYFPNSIKQ